MSTPETMMFQQLGGAFPREDRAAALGALQLAFSLLLFLGYLALGRRERGLARDPDPRRAPSTRAHDAVAFGATALALAPIGAVLAGGFRLRGAWSFEPWRAILDPAHPAHVAGFDLSRALGLSLAYAAMSVVLALLLTILLAYALPRLSPRPRRLVEAVAALPLGTSSLLLGVGYVLAFGAGAFLDLRGTTLVIVVTHALVAFPFAARVLLPAFDLRDRRLDDAAALLGASGRAVAWRVHLPLLAAPLTVAAGLAAAASLGDFGASVLLMRPDTMSLVVWIGGHDAPFDPMRKAQAIALAGALAVLTGLVYLAIERANVVRRLFA